jgi:hypothetical protein
MTMLDVVLPFGGIVLEQPLVKGKKLEWLHLARRSSAEMSTDG